MRRKISSGLVFFLAAALIAGCASLQTPMPQSDFTPVAIDHQNLVRKVDGFLVVIDASQSMTETYKGQTKFNLARETVCRLNRTVPELGYQAGLRRFGQTRCPFTYRTELVYGMTGYTTAGLAQGLAQVAFASGRSPLAMALDAAGTDLSAVKGSLALIAISDGKEMDDGPVQAAKMLKQTFGDRLCIYTVQVGNDAAGTALLEKVAAAGGCGAAVKAEAISAPGPMAAFVRQVFFTVAERRDTDGDGVYDDEDRCPGTPPGTPVDARGCPLDSDNDGVTDDKDRCPGTPAGIQVDAAGCPLDSDGDGVFDYQDLCPGTPRGQKVDAKGCSLDSDHDGVPDGDDACPGTPAGAKVDAKGCWVLEGVTFDTASAKIRPTSSGRLDRAADVLKSNPVLRVEVQGHTDNVGRAAYNQKLSEARAKAVRQYLIGKGVAADRMTAVGYGLNRPTATNDTEQGRAQNRRVELKPLP